MSQIKKTLLVFLLCAGLVFSSFQHQTVSAKSSDFISFVILSKYSTAVDVGDVFYIYALTSTGKLASWKSSDSKIASVNTYGKVTAKKAGTVTVTAKIAKAEASCKVTVKKTEMTINKKNASIERGETFKLIATASNNSEVVWKSSKKSIATISEDGTVTGIKPGETVITASAGGSSISCKVTVKTPTLKLDKTKIKLYRGQSARLSASVSSGITPVWKVNKPSVATVDKSGTITAVKNGTAIVTATVDGVSKSCEITVEKPSISLSPSELTLKKGESASIKAKVSSGNPPVWSVSNSNVLLVDTTGKITALKKGTAYVYASEDGTKVRCSVHVTE